MIRNFDAQSSIELPPLDGGSGATIGQQMLALAAVEKKLPANVMEARAGLEERTRELEVAVHAQAAASGGEPEVQPARQAEAAAWSGLEAWLSGYMKLPSDEPAAVIAARVHSALFDDGLLFLRLPTLQQWPETQRRVGLLAEKSLAADCAALGGQMFVATIQKRHAAMGIAAGITAARPPAPEAPGQGLALNALKAALRCYIAQLMANAALDRSGRASALLVRLVEPLASYDPPRHRAEKRPAIASDPATGSSS